MFFIFLLLFTSILTAITGQYGSDCLLPSQQRGLCVPVKSCKTTLDIFKNIQETGGRITSSDQEQLLTLHCGNMQNVHLVCCLESEIQLNEDGLNILKNTTCGTYNSNRVSNGYAAALFGFPWMTLIMFTEDPNPFKCGGSLISAQYVLTAAHCVHTRLQKLNNTAVRLGEHQISTEVDCIQSARKQLCAPPVEDVGLEEIIMHEMYNKNIYHDIALLRLNRLIEITQRHIKPICLPIFDELRNKEYPAYVISGWGKTEDGTTSDILQVAVVNRVERDECELQLREYRLRYPLTVGQICAGGEELIDTCRGDSGGPMGYKDFYNDRPRFIQFGIVSFGINDCGSVNVPGAYTNVSHYMQWITDHMH